MNESQKTIIINMLREKEWTCTTEMMAKFIPDYRRRLCDIKKDYELEGRPCQQHNHKSKILKEWRLVGKKDTFNEEVLKNGFIGNIPEENYFIYCNEKDENRGKFLFKCGEGCKHNPYKQAEQEKLII